MVRSNGREWGKYRDQKNGHLSTIEIAVTMGISQQRVHQCLESGLQKIRTKLKRDGSWDELKRCN